jgi:RNA polymerase sigma-70 factor (ECF subfamily)
MHLGRNRTTAIHIGRAARVHRGRSARTCEEQRDRGQKRMAEGDVVTRVSGAATPAPPSEAAVREALVRDDVRGAVETAVALYGAEVFGFVSGVMDDPTAARDAYVRFAERLWRNIGRFRWHYSLRTFCYGLARREIARRRAEAPRPPSVRSAPAPSRGQRSQAAGPDSLGAWTTGMATLRAGIDILRSELAPEDREILVLRVDRGLSWRDVALTTLDDVSEGDIQRESDRLALRFVAIKEQLARAAAAHGITPRSEHSDGNNEARDHGRVLDLRRPGRPR